MTTAIDKATQLLEDRRKDLLAELRGIEKALLALGSSSSRTTSRQPRGQRQSDLLEFLGSQPNAKPKEVAEALGISRPNASNLLSRMRKQKLIRRNRGGGYSLHNRAPDSI